MRDVLAEHVVVAEPYNVGRGEETSTEAILASTIRLAGLEGGRDALEEEQGALGREGRILLRDLLDLGDGLPHARDRQLRLPAGGNRPRVYPRH